MPILGLGAMVVLAAGCAHQSSNGEPWVHSLRIEGNHSFSAKQIEAVLATEKTGWWPFARRHYFDAAAFDYDLKRVVAFYNDHGYFDARVASTQIRSRGRGSVDLVIVVKEGAPTDVTDVALQGVPAGETKVIARLQRNLGVERGRRFDYQSFEALKQQVQHRLKHDGYAYARVDGKALVDREAHAATIEVSASSGPVVHFGSTRLVGNGAIPAKRVLDLVSWKAGDRVQPKDLRTTEGRLYNLGVFGSVSINLPPEPQSPANVAIVVSPTRLHEVRVGVGVGIEKFREEARARGEWTVHNFLGGLRTLQLRAEPAYVDIAQSGQRGFALRSDANLTQPDLFGANVTGHAVAGYDVEIWPGLEYRGPRALLGAERAFWDDRVLVGASWNLRYLSFYNVVPGLLSAGVTPLTLGYTNPYRLGYVEEYGSLDLRDRPLDPHEGAFFQAHLEEGGTPVGGQFQYYKITPEARGYLPLGPRLVLAARALGGWLVASGNQTSPVTQRYMLGGPSSHRGFGYGRLSPQVFDPVTNQLYPIGGDGAILLSAELRADIARLHGSWLGVVPFFDGGDVEPRVSQVSIAHLYYATGASLEYETPVGIVRVGMGVRLNRLSPIGPNGLQNADPGQRFNFYLTIGEAF